MASDVNLKPGESVKVNAPAGETLTTVPTATAITIKASGSDVVTPPPVEPPTPGGGRLPVQTRAFIDGLPKTGRAYEGVKSKAASSTRLDLSDQDSPGSANMLARGYMNNKSGVAADIAAGQSSLGRTARVLSLSREAQPIALAARLTGNDARSLLTNILSKTGLDQRGIGRNPREHAKMDPTNWGCHSRGSLAWAAYGLGDAGVLADAKDALTRYLTTGTGFSYKSDQQAWQPTGMKVCVGPKGAKGAGGYDADGALTNDAYRGGPPPRLQGDGANYVWEGFQGTISAAIALDMQGVPLWDIGDRAILRAALWMYRMGVPMSGDDNWIGYVLKKVYGSAWPHPLAAPGTSFGKGWGGTDWTYAP